MTPIRVGVGLCVRLGLTCVMTVVVVMGACGSATDTDAGSRLTVVDGPSLADTIEAMPAGPIVIRVSSGGGRPVVGTIVAVSAENAQVALPAGPFAASAAPVTDSRGEVAVMLRFGAVAGSGWVVVNVPTLQIVDTLELDVSAGVAVSGPTIAPADTLVMVGVPFSVSAAAGRDRRGNAVGATLQASVAWGPLTPSGSGFVGTAVGVGQLRAAFAGDTAFARVQVVPSGQLVFTNGSVAWLAAFDGTGMQQLSFSVPAVREPSVSWNRTGDRIVLGGYAGFKVFDLGAQTVRPTVWPGGVAGSDVLWPRFGPGGVIYYSSAAGAGWDIRKMDPDGTSPAILIPSSRFPNNDFFPDWDPDGSRLVLTADWEEVSKFVLRLFDPSFADTTTIEVEGSTPVWSPDGNLIAYWELGVVGVVSPDGSINRSWNPGWSKGVTWSPQSDMLVGIGPLGRIEIIDVVTGVTMTLPHFGVGNDAVAWRPAAPVLAAVK